MRTLKKSITLMVYCACVTTTMVTISIVRVAQRLSFTIIAASFTLRYGTDTGTVTVKTPIARILFDRRHVYRRCLLFR